MSARHTKRVITAGFTLLGVASIGLALWQNVTKRRAAEISPLKAAQAYPDYAPALIAANALTLSRYSSADNRREIAEGTLVFSEADASAIKSRAKAAFAHAPLSVSAITQIATADFLQTLNWSDRETLLLAKSRNARDRQTLMALSFIDMRGGNFDDLLSLMDLRHRLGNLSATDLQVLKGLSTLPEQRELIETRLAEAPAWAEDYFRFVIPEWTEQDIRDNRNALFVFLGAQNDDFVRQTLFRFYFQQLKRLGLYDVALEDWSALPEVSASGPKTSALYNGTFRNISAPQPFNWRTYEPALALAEIENTGGLYASSSAPKRVLLAQQLTTAPTGQALRLNVQGRWQYREQQGAFFWRFSCMPSRTPFYDIVMGDEAKPSGKLSFDIPPLPEDCQFQDLQLYAEPGGFNQRVSLRLETAEIIPRAMTDADRAVIEEGTP